MDPIFYFTKYDFSSRYYCFVVKSKNINQNIKHLSVLINVERYELLCSVTTYLAK
jgi:hypothetical protein